MFIDFSNIISNALSESTDDVIGLLSLFCLFFVFMEELPHAVNVNVVAMIKTENKSDR